MRCALRVVRCALRRLPYTADHCMKLATPTLQPALSADHSQLTTYPYLCRLFQN